MRLFHCFTRALIAVATTLHIKGLLGAVHLDDRKVAKAMRRTDAADKVAGTTAALLELAKDKAQELFLAEMATVKANNLVRADIQAEISGYRRGITV